MKNKRQSGNYFSPMNLRRYQNKDDASVKNFSSKRFASSGSMQGAGGVGGLLEVSGYGSATTNRFPAFDGNGNVAALINAADGSVAANDEYAAFGEPVRVTGVMARSNPFRFSTKYADDESDLLYYGYRYYKPSLRWQVSFWHTSSRRRGDAISPNPLQPAPRNPFQTP